MKKILLAEYDIFLTNIYASQLRKSGYSISIAPDGETVVSRTKNINPDLLILDTTFPKIDGFAILKVLRSDDSLRGIKVIMLSNFSEKEEIEKSFDLGAVKYFAKSENTAEEIVEEINQILN